MAAVLLGTVAAAFAGDDGGVTDGPKTPWPGGIWTPAEPSYGTAQDLQASVTMSDGVILTADILYPTDLATGVRASGQFPVLLTQSPNVRDDPKVGDYVVQRGYIYVTARVRGTRTSGGSFSLFSERDAQDGAELVEWVAKKMQNSNIVASISLSRLCRSGIGLYHLRVPIHAAGHPPAATGLWIVAHHSRQ